MRLKFIGIIILFLLQIYAHGQATKKISGQLPTSFYSDSHFKHDLTFKKDIINPENKIIKDLENPQGTLVVDGKEELRNIKEVLAKPDKIVFKERFVEIPYQAGPVTYRIPVSQISNHHSINDSYILAELKTFINECAITKNEIPALVTMKHNYDPETNACEFLSFSSISNLYGRPYHQRRLNLACVFIKILKKELDYYVSNERNSIRKY